MIKDIDNSSCHICGCVGIHACLGRTQPHMTENEFMEQIMRFKENMKQFIESKEQDIYNKAKRVYGAYCVRAGGLSYDNKPLPTFEQLGIDRQECWFAVIEEMFYSSMTESSK